MKPKNKPIARVAKQLAEIKLQQFDLAIDVMLSKSGISRVANLPALDKFINQKFVRDITEILLDAPDGIEQ